MLERHYFNPDIGYAMRLVRTGNATVEQAASVCGVSTTQLQALLAAAADSPQLKLQEVETRR